MTRVTRAASGLTAALMAVLACAVVATSGQAATTAVAVKPIPITDAKKLNTESDSVTSNTFFIAVTATKLLKTHHHRYPTGAKLASELGKQWRALNKQAHRKFRGKIQAGPVPSALHAKFNYYYVGRSTAKVFKILSVYRFEGHVYKVGYDLNTKGDFVSGVETYDQLLAESQGETTGDAAASVAYKAAHRSTGTADWVPAYPSPKTLVHDLVRSRGVSAAPLASDDPGPERFDGGMMFLGATTANEFDAVVYYDYGAHRALRVETTRTLTGQPKFKISALKVKF